MTSARDERPALDDAEREFLDRVARDYSPPPMTAAERAAFDEAIKARLERPERRPMWILSPVIGAAAAAALLWLVLFPASSPTRLPGEEERGVGVARVWEDELFLSGDLGASGDRDESETLPEDYLAIAGVFLGG